MNEEKFPIEVSVGGYNRHIFFCEALEQQRFYGVCLHLIDAWKAGRLSDTEGDPNDVYCDCGVAMRRGRCEARDMREKELDAGHAIYYRPLLGTLERPTKDVTTEQSSDVARSSESYKRGWDAVGQRLGKRASQSASESVSAAPAEQEERVQNEYAQAISSEVRKLRANTPTKARGGKSLLEIARSMNHGK